MHLRHQSYDLTNIVLRFRPLPYIYVIVIAIYMVEGSGEPEQLHAQNLAWIDISNDALALLRGAPLFLSVWECHNVFIILQHISSNPATMKGSEKQTDLEHETLSTEYVDVQLGPIPCQPFFFIFLTTFLWQLSIYLYFMTFRNNFTTKEYQHAMSEHIFIWFRIVSTYNG